MAGVVSFRHDEIRDFHDNIRIDYGYAMTIASAQGLTVDRAFLLDRRQAIPRNGLSRRHPTPRRDRRLRQPLSHRLRHRREPPRGRGGAAGDGQRRPRVPGRALVALPAQGGGARLHRRRRMAGCEGSAAQHREQLRPVANSGQEGRRQNEPNEDARQPRHKLSATLSQTAVGDTGVGERQRHRAHRR